MPSKRKYPFSTASYGGHSSRKSPRLQKRDDAKKIPVDLTNPSSLPPRAIEGVQQRVEVKIEHGKKLVFRALKKAKGFEKQKLVKRLKIARGKKDEASVKKLELEFRVLKTEEVDLNSLASNHILKTLSKSRSISTSLLFPPWIVSQRESEGQLDERETARRNIAARLYNSNPVKEEMLMVIENVRKAMGINEGETQLREKEPKSGKRQLRVGNKSDESEEGEENEDEEQGREVIEKFNDLNVKTITAEVSEGGSDGGFEEEWGGISASGESESVEIDLDALTADFDDRVAGSSDEKEDQGPLLRGVDEEWSGDEEDEEDEEIGDIGYSKKSAVVVVSEPTPKPKSKLRLDNDSSTLASKSQKSAKPQTISSAASTFLPTLMSGYISGSDSDMDADYYKDKKGKKKGSAEPKERKNRMGQQARRALWEKKFGKNANHVKKEEMEQGRKKVAQRINRSKGKEEIRSDGAEKKGKSTEVEGPLHPSWEAARKAKVQQAKVQEAVKGKLMGKKTVFD